MWYNCWWNLLIVLVYLCTCLLVPPAVKIMTERATTAQRPYFFWDYDISEEDIRRILRGDNEVEKAWVITRILEYARWEDIWRYLTLNDVRENYEQLRFRWPQDRELWAHALERWSHHD